MEDGWQRELLGITQYSKNLFRVSGASKLLNNRGLNREFRQYARKNKKRLFLLSRAVENIPEGWFKGDYRYLRIDDNTLSAWQLYKMLKGGLLHFYKACLAVSFFDQFLLMKGISIEMHKEIQVRPSVFSIEGFNKTLFKQEFCGRAREREYKYLLKKTGQFLSPKIFNIGKSKRFFKHVAGGRAITLTTANAVVEAISELSPLQERLPIFQVDLGARVRPALHEKIT